MSAKNLNFIIRDISDANYREKKYQFPKINNYNK